MNRDELSARAAELQARYDRIKAKSLRLDMTRGKPCPEQLSLSNGLLTCLAEDDFTAEGGTDCRNYGILEGIPEARRLFAEYMEVEADEIIVGGNSSLALMHNALSQAILRGVPGGSGPWKDLPAVRFLCPVPGYDRHFSICQQLGIEMLNVPMRDDGPDLAEVERLAANDATVKGIWCVPRYSNPTGSICSPAVVSGLASMRVAAPDFRVMWDNAYAMHHLDDSPPPLADLLAACKTAGNPERVLMFGSTSKITFPGAGIAMLAASRANIEDQLSGLFAQTIGPDKLNQLRHVRFFADRAAIEAQMRKHAAIIKPKFDTVLNLLEHELSGIAEWQRPRGGYFISLNTPPGCAARTVTLASDAGVKLTAAGATFPYGRDPEDRNIRLAPTLPSLEEIEQATELLCLCVQIAAAERPA
jgi:DNA-binding transcriptional MocR family regulator